MKRALVLSLIVAGAGCGKDATTPADGGTTPPDLTVINNPMPDLSLKPDMVTPPPIAEAKKIVSNSFFMYAVNPDNNIIAVDLNTMNSLVAVPVGGNKETVISSGSWDFTIRGNALLDWEDHDQNTNIGQGNIWTMASGLKGFANGDQGVVGIGDYSPDGKWIFYSGNAAVDGSAVDLYVAKSDTTGSMKFATGGLVDITADPAACTTHGLFTSLNKLVVIVCGQGDAQMGGAKGNLLEVVDPSNAMTTKLAGNVGTWFVNDPTGKYVAAVDNAGAIFLVPTAGGAVIPVDKDVADNQAIFTPDGTGLLYITLGGALKRATVGANPAPMTLVAANVSIFRRYSVSHVTYPAISPDGKWVIITNSYDDMTGIGDIFMASTTTPGMPTTLVADSTGEIFGDAFTTDGTYVLYYTKLATSGSGLIGTFTAKPIAGGNPVSLADKVWVSYNGTGTLSAFNDNYKGGKNVFGDYGTGDLRIVDVKTGTGSIKTIAVKADAEFFPTFDRKTLIFSTRTSANVAGLYSIPLSVP